MRIWVDTAHKHGLPIFMHFSGIADEAYGDMHPEYVAVNGKNCIIKRGEWVKIRRKFALVIDQSEIQDLKTAEFLESQQKKFEEANAAL